jgi:hypothetical protein
VQQQLNGNTGPESDLQDLVVRANVEHFNDLLCGIPVHARHDVSAPPSHDTSGTPEHAHQEFAHVIHGLISNEQLKPTPRATSLGTSAIAVPLTDRA